MSTINNAFDSAMNTIKSQLATKRNQIVAADPNASAANEISGKLSALTSTYLTGVAKLAVSD